MMLTDATDTEPGRAGSGCRPSVTGALGRRIAGAVVPIGPGAGRIGKPYDGK